MLKSQSRLKMNAVSITLGDWRFDWHDPIMVFKFLTQLTDEADLNQLTEKQDFATLPHFLSATAENIDIGRRQVTPTNEAQSTRWRPFSTFYVRT